MARHHRTPIALLHATLAPGAQLPWRRDVNALVYVLAGSGSVGAPSGRPACEAVAGGLVAA
jgi:hypothetical protein